MKNRLPQSLITLVVLLAGAAVGAAGSQGGTEVGDIPLFALLVGLAFLIQIVAFVPAFVLQSEGFYDLVGSLTYISLTLLAAGLSFPLDARSALLAVFVIVWAARLGIFLFRRVRKHGKDSRFDELKPSLLKFLNVWVIQGLWVTLTAGAAWTAIVSGEPTRLDAFAIIGTLVWLLGLGVESTADLQKARFRANPSNRGGFIRTGLWSWSRHPNYFGEIALWAGVALIALPALRGWQLLTLVSPVFVFLLITRVSGVPLLERHADETWGGDEDYESYKRRTHVLVPLPPRGRSPRR